MANDIDLHWICSVPICSSICILGLIGNGICALVWYNVGKKREKSNKACPIYLVALSLADNGVLVFFLFTDTLKVAIPSVEDTYAYAAFFSWVAYPLFFFFMAYSRWIMIAVTLTRYLVLKFPFRVSKFYTVRKTYITLAILALSAIPPNVPFWFYFAPKETKSGHKLSKTEFGSGDGGLINEFWVRCIVLVLIPFLSIAMLNCLIVFKLSRRTKTIYTLSKTDSSKHAKTRRSENQLTMSLLVITLIFITLLFWQCLSQCLFMLKYGKALETHRVWKYVDGNFALSKIGLVLNSAINGVIYSIFGSRFRCGVKTLFSFKSHRDTRSTLSLHAGNTRHVDFLRIVAKSNVHTRPVEGNEANNNVILGGKNAVNESDEVMPYDENVASRKGKGGTGEVNRLL